jgi:hypothetical protein
MGILRITMRNTSSQSVSGAFTAPEFTQECRPKLKRVTDPRSEAIATP